MIAGRSGANMRNANDRCHGSKEKISAMHRVQLRRHFSFSYQFKIIIVEYRVGFEAIHIVQQLIFHWSLSNSMLLLGVIVRFVKIMALASCRMACSKALRVSEFSGFNYAANTRAIDPYLFHESRRQNSHGPDDYPNSGVGKSMTLVV